MSVDRLQEIKENTLAQLHQGNLSVAKSSLDQGLELNFEDEDIVSMLKGVHFWQDRLQRIKTRPSDFDRANGILEVWSQFLLFCRKIKLTKAKIMYAFRAFAFTTMKNYLLTYNNSEGIKNPEILWRMGLCNKLLGNLEAARRFLEVAWTLNKDHPVILAELADIHALLNETDLAKLLFREAFALDPAPISLGTMESELINRLIHQVREQGVVEDEVCYWIPIFALLGGVFTSSRILNAQEYGRLKQTIYALEREYQEKASRKNILIPLLLNKYFCLLEHAQNTKQPKHLLDELLLKIESLHPVVYKLYTR
jgi:tetratricopeptide (TPR) repeat protein